MRHALILAVLVTCAAHAADPAPATPPDAAAIQAGMALMSTTGPEHAALARLVGEWDVQASMWMAPGAPPETFKDTATFTAILGGKWIRQDYRGERMGQPFTGLGMLGYDTIEKKYVAAWFDSFMTPAGSMTGTSSDGGTTITYISEPKFCPMTGGPLAMRQLFVFESSERMVCTMFTKPEGGVEAKGMEMVYTRRKAAK